MSPGGAAPRETWRAPAKINLWLAITGRRPDGYHEVDTGLQAIDLADDVHLEQAPEDDTLECRISGDWSAGVPDGAENLAARAARMLAARTGHALRVRIELVKAIPAGAGLGGGSSDAAAVLLALARRFAVPDAGRTLHALAAELGADVPFFLRGGTQRARGIGDVLAPVPPPAERWGVLVHPGVTVGTAAAYAAWDATGVPAGEPTPSDWRERGNAFEPIVFGQHPEVARAAAILGDGPATVVRMSGSGSAVFGLYAEASTRDRDLARVQRAVAAIPGARVWPFACVDHGVRPAV